MIDILDLFVKGLISAAAAAVIAAAVAHIKEIGRRRRETAHITKEEWQALVTAVKANTHDQFHRYCRYLLQKDSMTEDEYENLGYLRKGYRAMGLNGTGEKLYNQVIKKPIDYQK